MFNFVITCLRNVHNITLGGGNEPKTEKEKWKSLEFPAPLYHFAQGWLRSAGSGHWLFPVDSAKPWLLEGHLVSKGECYNSRGM